MININLILGLSNFIVGLLMIVLFIPLKKGFIKMDMLYGIRFETSFESEKKWYKINEYGAKRFMLWSFPLIAIGLFSFFIPFNENLILIIIFSFTPSLILIPTIESYLYAEKL